MVATSPAMTVTGNGNPATRTMVEDAVDVSEANHVAPFVPSLGVWVKPLKINPELKDPIPQDPPSSETPFTKDCAQPSDILPPELKEDGTLRFPWAAKMDPKTRNLHRTTSPTYLEDGTPMVVIPNHVLLQGLQNQKEYVIGQFYRCSTPPGGLIHAVTNRIWGKKCKIFARKLGDFSFLFHIPDESTRAWVLERGIWHIDDCIMFVAPWKPADSLALPEITSIPMWVTLKEIPACLYSDKGISWIASGLGEPMVTNKPRLDPTQMGEAKILVEVELDKAFSPRIAAADTKGNLSMVSVEYSWIPSTCERCGQLGHKKSRCLMLHETNANNQSSSLNSAPIAVTDLVKVVDATCEISAPETVTATTIPSTTSLDESPLASAPLAATMKAAHDSSNDVVVAPVATISTSASSCEEAEPATPTPNATIALENVTNIPSFGPSLDLVTFSTPPLSDSLANETVQGNVFGGNPFAALDLGVASFEMGDPSQRTKSGRPIKPSQKAQEMQWIMAGGRRKGRGGRGGRGSPS